MRRILSILVFLTLLYNGPAIATNTKPMSITATNWIVADESGRVIQGKNITEQRSIASITKLMTVMVVIDAGQDMDEHIRPYTRKELIQLALIRSDNHAAETLCKHYPGGRLKCINAMNEKSDSLGMTNTKFVDPTGLGVMNVSTATDLIKLVSESSKYSSIVESSKTSKVKLAIKKTWLHYRNTNPLVDESYVVSKTGYIRAAGGCIVMMLDTDIGRRIVILLGSKNTTTRIPEAKFLASNYIR